MRIKITVSPSPKPLDEPVQHYINGYVHKTVLGKENTYHDAFSNYSVSSMQGGTIKDGKPFYPNGGCFFISSPDQDFMSKCFFGIKRGHTIGGMTVTGISIDDFEPFTRYDIVRTIDPILLKSKELGNVTFENPAFVALLTDKCRKKLVHNGIPQSEADRLVIKPFHFEDGRLQYRRIGKNVNVGSDVSLFVEGSQRARMTLYELGFGYSTGCGFGAVEVISGLLERNKVNRKIESIRV